MASEGTPAEVRQAAAVNFKNHVKRHWNGTGRDVRSLSDGDATVAPVPDAEKVTPRPASAHTCVSAVDPAAVTCSQ